MIINEPVALFMVPLGKQIAYNAWEIIVGLNLMYVPLLFLIVREAFDARQQGADEGSSAVLAYKRFEFGFLAWLLVYLLFLMPAGGTEQYQYRQVSCNAVPSAIKGVTSVAEIMPRSGVDVGGVMMGSQTSPLATGVVNDLGVTFSSVMTGRIPCDPNMSSYDVMEALQNTERDEVLKHASKVFVPQCYAKGAERIKQSLANGTLIESASTQKEIDALYMYDSDAMLAALKGEHDTAGEVPSLKIDVDYSYLGYVPTGAITEIECLDAQVQMKGALEASLYEQYESAALNRIVAGRLGTTAADVKEGVVDFFSQFDPVAEHELDSRLEQYRLNVLYEDATGMNLGVDDLTINAAAQAMEVKRQLLAEEDKGWLGDWDLMEVLMAPAMGVKQAAEMTKSYAATLYIPLVVGVMQAVLLSVMPVIIVMSGMRMDIAVKLHVTYFALVMVPFFLNLGVYISTVMSSALGFYEGGAFAVDTVAAMAVWLSPMLWMLMMSDLGGKIGAGASMSIQQVASAADHTARVGLSTSWALTRFGGKNAMKYHKEQQKTMADAEKGLKPRNLGGEV
ncbi:hypothetical protein ACP3V3_16845 [Vibrio sp. PNB22_3_1]